MAFQAHSAESEIECQLTLLLLVVIVLCLNTCGKGVPHFEHSWASPYTHEHTHEHPKMAKQHEGVRQQAIEL
jgi:hypothetical protein